MNVLDNIITARVQLLFKQPFFGNMATRLKVVENKTFVSTAATDGRHLYYNTEFFSKLTLPNTVFVIAHEVLHVVFNHMDRRDNRHKELWNAACDYAINGMLIRDRIGAPPDIPYLHDDKYNGKSAEEIYDLLYDEYKDQEMPDWLKNLIDDHIDWDAEDESDEDGKGKPKLTEKERDEIRKEVIGNILQAIQSTPAGTTPGEIERIVKSLTEPKMNWRQVLRTQIQSLVRNDFTWSKPSRKSWHTGCILPGVNYDTTIDVAIALDMSGSITNEQICDFLSEVKGIMDEFKSFKIDLWCFDTLIYNHVTYTEDDDEINSYTPKGGGGTDFVINWEYMQEHSINPSRFIMFTDGYCNNRGWGDQDYCDTLFIVHGSELMAPFGDTVQYT
jgi:predicted metal-dependent peptidase